MEYPTRNGISIPLTELELPDSNLDLDRPENLNNHHNEWERRQMGRFAITKTLRDLERHQFILPVDVHREFHRNYDPPRFPTLAEALDEVTDAYELGETMRVYLIDRKEYMNIPITEVHMKTLYAEYNQLAR